MIFGLGQKTKMVEADNALAGREREMPVPERHAVLGTPLEPPFPEGLERPIFGMGCFWGAERVFWQAPGVYTTAVGYAGGFTPNPTYEEVCSGRTGHAEVVLVVFDPARSPTRRCCELFWENHDPTQGMRQGNDVGTQYRSAIYVDDRRASAPRPRRRAAPTRSALTRRGLRRDHHRDRRRPGPFYYAEDYHQQYLRKNPGGYCGLGGTGVSCPVGVGVASKATERSAASEL